MTDTELELPQGWIKIRLGDYLNFQYGKGLTKKDRKKGNIPVYGSSGIDGYHNKSLVKTPSLVIGRKGSAGKIHLVEESFWAIDTTYFVEETFLYEIKFLFHLLTYHSPKFIDSSTAVPSLRRDDAYAVNIPVVPLNEQKRIVSKIEELFSKIESTKQSLEHTKLQLEYYRYSLLKSLTQDKTKDWKIFSLQNIGSWGGGGTPSKRQPEFWKNGIIPWISPKDMIKLEIDDSIDKITKEAIQKSSAKIIKKNSILFVVRSGILRHTLPIALNKIDVSLNQDMKSLTPFDFVNPKYLLFTLFGAREEIRRTCSKDGTTVQSIVTSKLLNYELPIPSLPEQEQIVSQIEQGFSLIENTTHIVESSLQNLQTMKMSVLKQAFEGKLVPQDPNDEPASVLLEKIKAGKS